MSLPFRLTDRERASEGFVRESADTAKHVRYQTWRYKCNRCGYWVPEVDRAHGEPLCRRCAAAESRQSHLAYY